MFKKILFLIFIFQFGFSQERQLIKGKVIYRNIDVPAANVVNNTSQNTTITNDNGEFEILARVDDEIIFSSVQYIIRTVRVSEEIMKNKRLIVQINQRVRELDEVVITPDDTEKFLDLKEEQFKGFDYIADKSTRIQNVLLTALLSVNGLNFVTAISAAATSISNVGPGLGEVIGPNGNFSNLNNFSKWILSVGMILGRLELFAVLVLFIPSFWRKY